MIEHIKPRLARASLESVALFLILGLVIGIVLTEAVFMVFSPIILPDGAIATVSDREYLPIALDAISSAQDEILVVLFSASYETSPEYDNPSANRLMDALGGAKTRGVKVHIVIDSWYESNERAAKELRKNNIEVRVRDYNSASTHSKLLVIDKKLVIVGSTNWSHYSLDLNSETNVAVANKKIAGEFREYFFSLWETCLEN